MFASRSNAYVYSQADVYRLLELPLPANVANAPSPDGGVIVWCDQSLIALRDNPVVRRHNLVMMQKWYENGFFWVTDPPEPAYYRLRIPIPQSQHFTHEGQRELLRVGEEFAPAVIAMTAIVVHALATKAAGAEDRLVDSWLRCAETRRDHRFVIAPSSPEGVRLDDNGAWGDFLTGSVYAAAVRRLPDPCPCCF